MVSLAILAESFWNPIIKTSHGRFPNLDLTPDPSHFPCFGIKQVLYLPAKVSCHQVEVDTDLIKRCLQHDSAAQKELYERYSPRMYGMCLRYSQHTLEAQDILQEGFIRVFQQLHQFRNRGSFEGWLKRIFINTAITLGKREMKYSKWDPLQEKAFVDDVELDGLSRLSQQELLRHIQELPAGYRTVFNLFVIEGYTHKEIAKMLKISVSTSKSQLFSAKRSLKETLTKEGYANGRE
ncbi:RNA polymerase sigma factor [Bacteroidota bacterium]